MPESSLDGQLLLFRAVERVGIKKYVAASWNFDWKNMNLGVHERYDAYIAFRNQVELSSDITPNYFLTRVLAEVLFSPPGHGDFSPANKGAWDPKRKAMGIWGTERDAAEFTVAVIGRDYASEGGIGRYPLASILWKTSPRHMGK
ncbi:hypothetical protein ACKRZS_007616 [Fusarium odoratissimum]